MSRKSYSSKASGTGVSPFSLVETLESRQLLSGAPAAKFGASTFYFNDVQASASGGSGSSPTQSLKISNTGTASLTISTMTLGGSAASEFTVGSKAPITISAGSSKSINLSFSAKALGVQTASLTVKTNDAKHATNTINLRGLGTAGTGGTLEPSLQRILDLFQIPDKVGEPHPEQNAFPIPPSGANDEVNMQTLAKAGSGSVSIQLLAVFDNFKSPATSVGYYTPGSASATTQLFSVPNSNDAQSVHPATSGSTSFDPGSKSFGIYTVFPAFSNRKAYSEDALNSWETVTARQKKIRFYPLKNPDGSKVANAYVFAAEDYNKAFDYNDVVGIIRNVKLGSTSGGTTTTGTSDGSGTGVTSINGGGGPIGTSGGNGSIGNISGLKESNLDHAPANDRLVANRIQNPDPVRPNVTHDHSELRLTNTSGSPITITTSLDNSAWTFTGGGGTFTLSPGATKDVTLKFVGSASGSTILKVFNGNLKITANGKTDTVKLDGLWQAYSEKLPSGKYDEPSLATLVNSIFGYKTTIVGPGQTTNHKGQPGTVGDEVASAYWKAADSSKSVDVRMIAATHRQNNFDPVTHEPLPANSEISWYVQGSTSKTFLFKHNIDEGQSLLQHISGSTTAVAEKTFSPGSKVFGFEVDKHYTDRTMNALDFDPATGKTFPGSGYAWRFFPLKDENGNTVANTYIAAMDYTANQFANWDYNDNVYLITNIKPSSSSSSSSSAAVAQAKPAASLFADSPSAIASVLDSAKDIMN